MWVFLLSKKIRTFELLSWLSAKLYTCTAPDLAVFAPLWVRSNFITRVVNENEKNSILFEKPIQTACEIDDYNNMN